MEEESPDKFMGIEGHDSGFIVSLPIPVCKGDLAVINREYPVI